MLRRVGLTVAAAVALIVGGGGLAYALWSVSQPLPAVTISTGTFDLQASWREQPDLTEMFPGHTAQGAVRVTLGSPASWQYSVDIETNGAFAGSLDATWFPGCEGDGISPGDDTNGTTLPGNSSTDFCIEFTLAEGTPDNLQGQTADVTVVVTAEQVLS